MLSFESDYIEGACKEILDALIKTNFEQLTGYGHDSYCDSAKKKIKEACGLGKDGSVYFLVGGTQTNQCVIDTCLRPFEGVIAATTGHVSVHEAGAIEFTGHKVLTIPAHEGKMDALELDKFISDFKSDGNCEHMVQPGMVYISHPTEYGTLYTKKELESIADVCHKNEIPLFIDGARLGYALASYDTDVTLKDIARICDVFYIGGTKVGALFGEAVVFTKNNEPPHFEGQIKRHGALLAKGRLLGIQFDTLFTNGLYEKLGKHAIEMAELLKKALKDKGYKFFLNSPTNQQFVILENKKMEELKKNVAFSFWEKYDDNHTVVRFATSWATSKENLEKLISLL